MKGDLNGGSLALTLWFYKALPTYLRENVFGDLIVTACNR